MRELFTRGLRGESQKETEIGLVPESWDVPRLDDVALRSSTARRSDAGRTGGYPVLRIRMSDRQG